MNEITSVYSSVYLVLSALAAGGMSVEAYGGAWLQFSVSKVAAVQPLSAPSGASPQAAPCSVQ